MPENCRGLGFFCDMVQITEKLHLIKTPVIIRQNKVYCNEWHTQYHTVPAHACFMWNNCCRFNFNSSACNQAKTTDSTGLYGHWSIVLLFTLCTFVSRSDMSNHDNDIRVHDDDETVMNYCLSIVKKQHCKIAQLVNSLTEHSLAQWFKLHRQVELLEYNNQSETFTDGSVANKFSTNSSCTDRAATIVTTYGNRLCWCPSVNILA